MNSTRRGFTIIELLVVIVVIAILAALSIVAYNGIAHRANDSAVKSDIRNLAMQVREQQAINGVYPTMSPGQSITGIEQYSFSKSSYDMSVPNLYYCVGNIDGVQHFGIVAVSKSGKKWMRHSDQGAGEYLGSWGSAYSICNNGLGFGLDRTFTHAINAPSGESTEGTWKTWVKN